MARYGLNLDKRKDNDKKKKIGLIVGFLCFVLVLGSVSLLLLWKSLNYDFNNFFNTGESTTAEPEITTEAPERFEGGAMFLVGVTTDDKKTLDFAQIISVDLGERTIRVVPVSADTACVTKKGKTLSDIVFDGGGTELKAELSEIYGENISRYVMLTENDYKTVFRTMGDIKVKLPAEIVYDTDDMFLELSEGENDMTPEKTYKYMKYLCETYSPEEAARKNADLSVFAFDSLYNTENLSEAEDIFKILINNCTSDISIVDFTENKNKLSALLPKDSKEKLKVFVSDSLKIAEIED